MCVTGAATAQVDLGTRLALAGSLPQVVISGTRFAAEADTQPVGISVISADQIRQGGYTTVNEAVMRQLGVPGRLDLNGGGEYALDLRGFGGTSDSNMVIVVDGIRVSEGDTGGTRLAGIPIETVERIEVLRGSNAVLYGEGATAGVIVITTKAGKVVDDVKWIFPWANNESLLYCILCEGHLVRGARVAVFGASETAAQVALLLHVEGADVQGQHGDAPKASDIASLQE